MKKFLLLLSLALTLVLTNHNANSAPAYPGIVTITQPDGSEFSFRIIGDEFFNYRLTTDGYHIVQLNDGFHYYYTDGIYSANTLSRNNSTMLVRANNPGRRSSSERAHLAGKISGVDPTFKAMGVQAAQIKRQAMEASLQSKAANSSKIPLAEKGLVILAEFSNLKFNASHSKETFERLLNEKGYNHNGATGSSKDYFIENSLGKYNPTFTVTDIVTLPNSVEYYGENDSNGDDKRPAQMVLDACRLVDAKIDFSQFDANKDGIIDDVFVFFAGHNEAEGGNSNRIWPHKWIVANSNSEGSRTFDGLTLYGYACTSELRGASGTTLCGIGTFTHEFGHVLGLSDLYDTNYEEDGLTVGVYNYSIMSAGNYNNNGNTPPYYCGYERYQLGWNNITFVNKNDIGKTITIEPLHTENGNDLWAIETSTKGEIFLIESRVKEGWDQYIGSGLTKQSGLLIYHIDSSENQAARWINNEPNAATARPCMKLVESTGKTYTNDTNPTLEQVSYPGKNNRTTFTNEDYGYKDWSNKNPEIGIKNIVNDNGTITLEFTMSENLKITALQYQAMIEFNEAGTLGVWTLRYRPSLGEWITIENIVGQYYTLENLEPNNIYEIEAFVKTTSKTLAKIATTLPSTDYPRIGGIENAFNSGDILFPYVENLQEKPVFIKWFFDGYSIETVKLSNSSTLKCVIKYQDGSIETITRKINVR